MDLLELILDLVLNLAEAIRAWRFCCCVLVAGVAIVSIAWLVPHRMACLALGIPVGIAGVVQGILWEMRHR